MFYPNPVVWNYLRPNCCTATVHSYVYWFADVSILISFPSTVYECVICSCNRETNWPHTHTLPFFFSFLELVKFFSSSPSSRWPWSFRRSFPSFVVYLNSNFPKYYWNHEQVVWVFSRLAFEPDETVVHIPPPVCLDCRGCL